MPDNSPPRASAFRLRVRSLRVRAFLVVLAVGCSPLILVYASGFFETGLGARLLGGVRDAADETYKVLASEPDADVTAFRDRVDAIARSEDVRVRVLEPDGSTVLDVDRERVGGIWRTITDVWYGPGGVASQKSYDRTLGPVLERPEVAEARARGHAAECRTVGGESLVCWAVRIVDRPGQSRAEARRVGRIIYVQDAAPRAIGTFSDLRDQLGRLTLFVLPAVLFLAWWLGWRFVVPIENLREQILAKAAVAAPRADVGLERRDEFGDLAQAFNDLLGALHERAKANEAFVADLAHEFKNPVAAVRAAGESLDRGAIDAERAARISSVLKDSGTRLDALVTQFLELARAEAGLPDEPRSDIDLVSMARGLADAFSKDERWLARKIRFETSVTPADARVVIRGLSDRLETALRNLVQNAASFSPEGAAVRIEVTHDRGEAIVRITDSGPGIASEDLPRVFNRFFSTRPEKGGTGLGLALVRAVVEGHAGTVRALSRPGEGATFEVRIPITEPGTSR